jgi:hypothetical protein
VFPTPPILPRAAVAGRPPDQIYRPPYGVGDDPTVDLGLLERAVDVDSRQLESPAFVDLPVEDDLVIVLRIGNEKLAVLERGALGTTATPHASDAHVYMI